MFTSSLIQRAYQLTKNSNTKDELRYSEDVKKLLQFNKENAATDLLVPMHFYLGLLEDTHAAFFPFLAAEQKNQIIRDLQVTYLLLLAEKQYELEHQKTEHIKEYDTQLKKCRELIDELLYLALCKEKEQRPSPEQAYASEDKPAAYLGIFAGFAFADQMVNMADRKTKTIKENMGWVNEKRLYWVWGSSFLKTMLTLLPTDFFYSEQAQQTIRYPDPYTGTMSWGLYYFRFALNLGLLLKHTIAGPWMSEAEKSEPWTDRFKTQWAQRKFTLLNDSVWATGNLLCFFVLVGQGAAGTWGDVLTIALLVFDIALAVWEYEELRIQHNKQMLDYDTAIKKLKAQIDEINLTKATQEEQEKFKQHLIELNLQLSALERARNQCQREWNHQKIILATNIAYAVGLMVAFTLLAAPFFPLPALTVAAITVSGAVLCFALSVIYNAVKGGLEIHKTKATIKELKEEREQKIAAFKELVLFGADENAKKLLFLEVKKLSVETEYQKKMVSLQTMRLLRSIMIETLIPAVVFTSLVFLPLGTGLGILGAALAVAIATHFLINKFFKAEKAEIKEFNELEYQEFCANPECWSNKAPPSNTFFQSKKEPSLELSQGATDEEIENRALLDNDSAPSPA